MTESYGGLPDLSPEELEQEFPYDSKPVHPEQNEPRPLESLAGRGQTEGTPMGLGPVLSWAIAGVFVLVLLMLLGSYVYSLAR